MKPHDAARRHAFERVGALVTGQSAPRAQGPADAPRLPPRAELVNTYEFEEVAKLRLPPAAFSTITGSDRAAFDRMTFRPRMMIPTLDMDLSVELFGERHFTPILVGPAAEQRQYHPDGELATVRGAGAARAAVVVSSRSSVPIAELAAQAKTPLWCAVYAGDSGAPDQARQAVAAGCKAVCITIGGVPNDSGPPASGQPDWAAVDRIRTGLDVPVLIKGLMRPEDAQAALEHGARGLVVSNHGRAVPSGPAPIDVLASIADDVGGKAAILIDGSFRRGTDILKALILGAQGVLIARPAMWGLAAYGAEGVQSVIELLQTDLGRNMGALSSPNLQGLRRDMLRIHKR